MEAPQDGDQAPGFNDQRVEAVDEEQWEQVEEIVTQFELPPLPPTSDPQRLLTFVLRVLPKYNEMEMLCTHLKLQSSLLEQELVQIRHQMNKLTTENDQANEKKAFLERYAAQVVKERNQLLHNTGSSSTKVSRKRGTATAITDNCCGAATSSHFIWHNCCRRNSSYAMDVTPSIASLRGEKLTQAMHKMKKLVEERNHQQHLRQQMEFFLKQKQLEHECALAANQKQVAHLEKQIQQRAVLFTALERRYQQVQVELAQHDQVTQQQLDSVRNELTHVRETVQMLQEENATLRYKMKTVTGEKAQVDVALQEMTEARDKLANRFEQVSVDYHAAVNGMEALRGEIELLKSEDMHGVKTAYATKIQTLQLQKATREKELLLEIDRLRELVAKGTRGEPKERTRLMNASGQMETDEHMRLSGSSSVSDTEQQDHAAQEAAALNSAFDEELDTSQISSEYKEYFNWETVLQGSSRSRSNQVESVNHRQVHPSLNRETALSLEDLHEQDAVSSSSSANSHNRTGGTLATAGDDKLSVEELHEIEQESDPLEVSSRPYQAQLQDEAEQSTTAADAQLVDQMTQLLAMFTKKRQEQEAKASQAHSKLCEYESRHGHLTEDSRPAAIR